MLTSQLQTPIIRAGNKTKSKKKEKKGKRKYVPDNHQRRESHYEADPNARYVVLMMSPSNPNGTVKTTLPRQKCSSERETARPCVYKIGNAKGANDKKERKRDRFLRGVLV